VFQLKNKAGNFITPSLAATTAAASGAAAALAKDVRSPIVNSADPNAYPIAGLTYLLVYQDQKDADQGEGARELHRVEHVRGAGRRRGTRLRAAPAAGRAGEPDEPHAAHGTGEARCR
jgi:hypothetical protein